MLKVRVIPCLDVKDGRVVKGVQFVNLVDAGDPVEQAQAYDAAGADELMFLDITASHENRGIILDVVARTADVCFMPLSVGGGIRSVEDGRRLLLAGADKISVLTAAVNDRDGTVMGFNVDAFGAMADAVSIPVIAAGGLASVDDISRLKARKGVPVAGAVLGRALYNGAINPAQALEIAA